MAFLPHLPRGAGRCHFFDTSCVSAGGCRSPCAGLRPAPAPTPFWSPQRPPAGRVGRPAWGWRRHPHEGPAVPPFQPPAKGRTGGESAPSARGQSVRGAAGAQGNRRGTAEPQPGGLPSLPHPAGPGLRPARQDPRAGIEGTKRVETGQPQPRPSSPSHPQLFEKILEKMAIWGVECPPTPPDPRTIRAHDCRRANGRGHDYRGRRAPCGCLQSAYQPAACTRRTSPSAVAPPGDRLRNDSRCNDCRGPSAPCSLGLAGGTILPCPDGPFLSMPLPCPAWPGCPALASPAPRGPKAHVATEPIRTATLGGHAKKDDLAA